MEHNQNGLTPEAATDEPASPFHDGRRPGGSRPRPPDDTPDRQCVFLDALARCGVAADAARAAGISRDTAYALRNSAEGAAFALGWQGAILISHGRMSDELESRALNGVVDRIYRNGELWGERHRHDNRLAMAVLTRLDRQADGLGEGAATARAIAREWDQFLDIVEDGGDDAGEFLASRAAKERDLAEEARTTAAGEAGVRAADDLYHSLETFERLFAYSMFGGGLDGKADMTGLEPADMENWTGNDWDRADRGGPLESLRADEWPEAIREPGGGETNGTCRNRQDIAPPTPGGEAAEAPRTACGERISGLARARREYAWRFPRAARPGAAVEQSGGSDITSSHFTSEGGSG
ncbi:MAG TPA: hypothetical protein VFZ91_02750 [Allosphingosinicella sp.]